MRHMKIITFFGRLPSDKIKSPTNRMGTCTTPHQTIWSQHLHHQRDNVLTTTFSTRGTARKASYFIKHLRHKESIANFHHMSTNTCSTRHTAQHLSYFIKNMGPAGNSPNLSHDCYSMYSKVPATTHKLDQVYQQMWCEKLSRAACSRMPQDLFFIRLLAPQDTGLCCSHESGE